MSKQPIECLDNTNDVSRPLHRAASVADDEGRRIVYRSFGYQHLTSANELLLETALQADRAMPVQHPRGSEYQRARGGPAHDMRLFTIHQTYRGVSEPSIQVGHPLMSMGNGRKSGSIRFFWTTGKQAWRWPTLLLQ